MTLMKTIKSTTSQDAELAVIKNPMKPPDENITAQSIKNASCPRFAPVDFKNDLKPKIKTLKEMPPNTIKNNAPPQNSPGTAFDAASKTKEIAIGNKPPTHHHVLLKKYRPRHNLESLDMSLSAVLIIVVLDRLINVVCDKRPKTSDSSFDNSVRFSEPILSIRY